MVAAVLLTVVRLFDVVARLLLVVTPALLTVVIFAELVAAELLTVVRLFDVVARLLLVVTPLSLIHI